MKKIFIILIAFLLIPSFTTAASASEKKVRKTPKLVNKHRKFLDDLPLVEDVRIDLEGEEKFTGQVDYDSLVIYDFDTATEAEGDTPVLLNVKVEEEVISHDKTTEYEEISTITYDIEPVDKEQIYNGKDIYKKHCRLCHGPDKRFIRKYGAKKWIKIFENDGVLLSKAHDKKNISRLTNKYFKSSNYPEQVRSLRDFIMDSAKKQ